MQILLTDYHCASNRGDAAILEGEIAALREVFPDAEFTIMTEYPTAATAIHGSSAVEQKLAPCKLSAWKKNAGIAALLLSEQTDVPFPGKKRVHEELDLQPYYDADVVVSTGGIHLTDSYFPEKIGVLAEFELCRAIGVPVVIYSQSLGPFNLPKYRSVIRYVLNHVDLITTRDDRSIQYLRELGVTDPPMYSFADAAFMLPTTPSREKNLPNYAVEDLNRLDEDDLLVSISVRNWGEFDNGSESQYFEAVANAAETLITDKGASILFASTCTGLAGYHTDDRIAAHSVINKMDDESLESVKVLTGEYTPHDLVEILSRMDFHIGTRMHSSILAMLGGTVPIPIEYQFKTSGLMEQFGMAEYVIDIDTITADEVLDSFRRIQTDVESLEERIDDGIERLRDEALEPARLIQKRII